MTEGTVVTDGGQLTGQRHDPGAGQVPPRKQTQSHSARSAMPPGQAAGGMYACDLR